VGRDEKIAFHPHGIYLLRPGRERRLYVVNHVAKNDSRIEIFTVDGDRLIAHWPPLGDRALVNPNDVVALQNGDIYVTNLSRYRSRMLQLFEALFGLKSGSVLRYVSSNQGGNGRWEVAVPGIASANGIAVTSDGKLVFVAATLGDGILVFSRKPGAEQGAEKLELQRTIELDTGIDNLSWENQDQILIAARHPRRLAVLWHAFWPGARSPSEIYQIDVTDTANKPKAIYGNDGAEISAASVGVVTSLEGTRRLYMGQVFDGGVLGCSLESRK
jgi:sugar lactone lactonase YvrE